MYRQDVTTQPQPAGARMNGAKIVGIDAVQPPTPGSPDDWRTQLGQILVRVRCDDGSEGLGVGAGGQAGIHVVQTVLADALVGQPADDPAQLHSRMCRATSFFGRKGVVVMALSGVDLANWDRLGRVQGKPVAELLNPQVDLGRALPTYATVWDADDAERLIQEGADAVKLHVERFGAPPRYDDLEEMVELTRDRLGPDKSIMVDAFGNWDVATTLRVAQLLQPYDLGWIEEPLQPDDCEGYQRLCELSPVPIAGGEHEYLREGFQWLADQRMHSIFQPDINWCGGLTTLRGIYAIADQYGISVCPHRGAEPFALHAIAALDPTPLAESGREWFDCLEGAPAIRAGRVQLPVAPGFGVSVAEHVWKAS